MKKIFISIIVVILMVAVAIGVFVSFRQKKNQNEEENIDVNADVIVAYPIKNQIISSPLSIEGKARGTWFFEASFPIKLLDKNGNQLAIAIAQAQSDWMTEDFVSFKAKLSWNSLTQMDGILVFEKDNPSDLLENAGEFRLPVVIGISDNIIVKTYFNNSNMDPEFSCNKVFSVEREIPKTQATARAAIEELLKGPTDDEKSQGFFTTINTGVKIQHLTIENGTAKIDFDEQLEFQVGGSCRVSAIRAEITQTLKQFSTIKEVIISINNRTEDILQP